MKNEKKKPSPVVVACALFLSVSLVCRGAVAADLFDRPGGNRGVTQKPGGPSNPADGRSRAAATLEAPAKPRIKTKSFTVLLSWSPVRGADRYQVQRCTGKSASGCSTHSETTRTRQADTSATPGVSYFYRIAACNADGCGQASLPVEGVVPLPEPLGELRVNVHVQGRPVLGWRDSGPSPVGGTQKEVRFFRCKSTAASTCSKTAVGRKAALNGRNVWVVDPNTRLGERYHYAVRICVNGGCGPLSDIASGWHVPAQPGRVSASDGTRSDGIELTWSPVSGADYYLIRREHAVEGPPVSFQSAVPSFLDSEGVRPGAVYQYLVSACLAGPEFRCGFVKTTIGRRVHRKEHYRFIVPVSVTNLHPDIQFVTPMCRVFDNAVMSNANQIDRWRVPLAVPANRQITRNVPIVLKGANLSPGKRLQDAIRYTCTLYVQKSRNGPLLSLSQNNSDPALRVAPNTVSVVTGEMRGRGIVSQGLEGLEVRTAALRANGQWH